MADRDEAGQLEPDPEFAPSERLFRRVPAWDVVGDSVNDTALPSPSFSVNREKYSVAHDVLKGHEGFRVAAFLVSDLPDDVASNEGYRYRMGVEHEPVAENYSHSGVHTFQEGIKLTEKPPKHVRKKLRDLLRRGIKILILESPN